jgi:hypothetical protein
MYFSIILLLASMVLNFPFPDKNSYGEAVVLIMNIPVKTVNGINYVGLTSLTLLIGSLYFLGKSLKKFHKRFIIMALLISIFTPPFLVEMYQKTFATGINAIVFNSQESKCRFDMTNKKLLHGECDLPFKNYSRNDVKFTIEFYDMHQFGNDDEITSLMNNNAPYEVKLRGRESKNIKVETNIDVSKMKNHIEGGEANGVHIIIKSGGKSRKL